MKQRSLSLGWIVLIILVGSGCDSGYEQEKKAEPQAERQAPAPTTAPAMSPSAEETTKGAEEMAIVEGALLAPEEAAGAKENNEGVKHYEQGHWDVAQEHFTKALAANPDLVEAHYNLALALDKLGQHGEATNHFQMALDLAPEDTRIKDSQILKAHLGG